MSRVALLPTRLVRGLLAGLLLAGATAGVDARTVVLATTAPLQQSALLAQLLPAFQQSSGLDVKVVIGTPEQAVAAARSTEADVVLIDDRALADKLVADGIAAKRLPVMTMEFLLVGPKQDPAGARGKDVVAAFRKLETTRALFISRGDGSPTNAVELRFWAASGFAARKGAAYRACKCGMGNALGIAASAFGYALTDKATWSAFRDRGELDVLVDGDPKLVVPWDAAAIAHERLLKPKTDEKKAQVAQRTRDAQKLVQWLTSPATQAAIGAFRLNGQPFFLPVVGK